MLCDAHLHLHETSADGYPRDGDIGLMFSCTARPSEWASLESIDSQCVKRFYGVHPWYCDEWSENTESELLALLKEDPSSGVGEIGLDGTRGTLKEQVPVFRRQLEITSSLDRAVNIHMVDAEKETLECIRDSACRTPMILHSFKSESYVKPFSALNCYFSLNPRILSKKPESVEHIFCSIPRDRLLLESDAPHSPKGFAGMREFISGLSDIVGVDAEELEETVYENLRSIA